MVMGMGVGAACFCAVVGVGVMRIIMAVPMVVENGLMHVVMGMVFVDQIDGPDNHERQRQQEEKSWRFAEQQQ